MTTTAPDTTSLRNRTPRSAADLVASAQELQPLLRENAAAMVTQAVDGSA